MTKYFCVFLLLFASSAVAQVRPGVFTTVETTDVTATSLCVGCPQGSTTPATNSGLAAASVTLLEATPSVTTDKLYNVAGALYFNGLGLATGSSISGTTGTVPKFTGSTSLGNSNATISGTAWTIAGALTATSFTGTVATSNLSGNYVATVASGTGITSSVTSGTGAATSIKLNDTAVTPSGYGSSTAIPTFTVDQQGRLTAASTATPQLTLTSTYFSSLTAVGAWTFPPLVIANAGGAASLDIGGSTGVSYVFYRNANAGSIEWDEGIGICSGASLATSWTVCHPGLGSPSIDIPIATGIVSFPNGVDSFSSAGPITITGNAATYELTGNGTNGLGLGATNASGQIRFYAGGGVQRMKLWADGGLSIGNDTDPSASVVSVGAPTGSVSGGSVNVDNNVYKNGTAYTNPDYVFEQWATGQIVLFKQNEGADRYAGLAPLSDVEAFARTRFMLPRIADARAANDGRVGLFDGGDAVLASIEEAYLYLFQHDDQLRELSRRLTILEAHP